MSVDLQYLSCLSSSRASTDKLAFDVGLREEKGGRWIELCFFDSDRNINLQIEILVNDDLSFAQVVLKKP